VLVRPLAAIERDRRRQEETWKLSKEDGSGESVGAREGEDSAPSGQRLRQSREKPNAAPRGSPVVSAQANCLQLVASSKQLWPVLKVHRIEGTKSTPRRVYNCMASCSKSVQVLGALLVVLNAFFVDATQIQL
jgi:hypothetical protein